MSGRRTALALAFAFAILCGRASALPQAPAAPPAAPATAVDSRIVVTCDAALPEVVDRVTKAVSAALPVFEAETGVKLPQAARLVIRLYATEEAYANAVTQDEAPEMAKNRAATTWKSLESFVVVMPSAGREFLQYVDYLPEILRCLAIHEAAHQFAWKAGLFPPKFLPQWYCEGQAEWLTQRAIRKDRAAAGTPMFFLEYQQQVYDASREGRLPKLDALLRDGLASAADTTVGYGASWSLYSFLADPAHGEWNKKFLIFQRELQRKGRPPAGAGPQPTRGEIDRMFRGIVGDLAALDAAWKRTPPVADWIPVWRTSEIRGEEIVAATQLGGMNSLLLRSKPVSDKGFALSGELIILAGGEQQADVVFWFSRDPEASLKLAIRASGGLTLMGRRNKEWVKFAEASCGPLTLGGDEWHAFDVAVTGRHVAAHVAGGAVSTTLPEGWLKGTARWGVGTLKSIARFRNLRAQ